MNSGKFKGSWRRGIKPYLSLPGLTNQCQDPTQIADEIRQTRQRSYASHLDPHGPQRVAIVWSCPRMALATVTECSMLSKESLMFYVSHRVGRTCPTLHSRSTPANKDHQETRLLPPLGHAPPKRAYPRPQNLAKNMKR